MTRRIAFVVSVGVLSGSLATPVWANERTLARARQLYNAGDQDAAIAAAKDAQADAKVADAARIVLARAYLERFRVDADRQDLDAAREALQAVRATRLAPHDRLDLAVGFGEALYLDGAYGAAAEMFEPLLDAAAQLGPGAHERVVDWWASALDAQARARPAADRAPYYRRIAVRMEAELEKDPGLAVASYWLAAGALGMGDAARAWQAAVAGWVRAAFSADRGAAMRADLDRLMIDAIIPDRVRTLSLPVREVAAATTGLRDEWELVKQRWK